jgi:hypothetical protein
MRKAMNDRNVKSEYAIGAFNREDGKYSLPGLIAFISQRLGPSSLVSHAKDSG